MPIDNLDQPKTEITPLDSDKVLRNSLEEALSRITIEWIE
jgi:hypothetical protein